MTTIRDGVFPLGSVLNDIFELCGTGFLLGDGTVALTAGHVIDQAARRGPLVGLFVVGSTWHSELVVDCEVHPEHDVAVVRFGRAVGPSIVQVSGDVQLSSAVYHGWGYPDYVAEEDRSGGEPPQPGAVATVNPDLIFRQGYVRRRLGWALPYSSFKGSSFLELSEVFGSCCSGAPLILMTSIGRGPWKCMGIYVGERSGHHTQSVGLAVPGDVFASWAPSLVGQPLESLPPSG
ncbi:trypsin-like peptidase domain-containing protein [Brevundimonas sp. R86498]|uniref:trypsin-like peptidase domain-containing protein n=1 Tax=Brevundimonas sp. R86498 TaxID=3093845 RepID=UPI0037C95FE1